jgi:nicotinamidase/pyrazinamidase
MKLPEPDRVAAFDVDAQRTFTPLCPDELPVQGGHEIGSELNRQAALARWRLGSKDAHSPAAVWVTEDPGRVGKPGVPGDNVEEYWPTHAVPGTEGFELVPGLPRPNEYDYFVWKGVELDMHPYGACYHDLAERMSTGVIEWLRARGVSHVLVGGLATDFCVQATARQLAHAGFDTVLNLAACRGIGEESTRAAVESLRDLGVRIVEDSSELERAA